MIRILPLAAALALAGCATATATSPHHEGPAALGQATRVGGPMVTPLRVVEDSRCPMNARCVWAGRVVLTVRIVAGRQRVERDLVLNEPVHVADGMLSLTQVTPDRVAGAGHPLRPGDYRFSFAFEGGL